MASLCPPPPKPPAPRSAAADPPAPRVAAKSNFLSVTKGEIRREERNRQRRRAIKVRREALHPQQATK